ncbi:MAG: hypothetical protein K2F86_09795 [Duncaniella sp.]|nr:hypothetical protein [Duncaniella sp.]
MQTDFIFTKINLAISKFIITFAYTKQSTLRFAFINMDFVSRLKLYLDSRQISVTQFADECRIPRPTASQLLAGRNKKVSDEIIGKIHQCYPEVSVVWLMFGEGEMLIPGAEPARAKADIADTETDAPSEAHAPEDRAYYGKRDADQRWSADEFANKDRSEPAPKPYAFASANKPKQEIAYATATEESANATTNSPKQAKPREFTFANTNNNPQTEPETITAPQDASDSTSYPKMGIKQFVIPSGNGKRVIGVVVYYDDHTFESFIPDEQGGRSFMI